MDDVERTRFRALLEAQRAELDPSGLTIDPLRDDATSKVDDDAKPLSEMTQVITSSRIKNRSLALAQLEAALKRLDRDPEAFGLCEECDGDIPLRRLELMPWARLCVACQQAQEGDVGPGRRRHLGDFG